MADSTSKTVRPTCYTPKLKLVGDKCEMTFVPDPLGAWVRWGDFEEVRRRLAVAEAEWRVAERWKGRYRKKFRDARKRIKELESPLPSAPTVEAEVKP